MENLQFKPAVPLNVKEEVSYAEGSIVSKVLTRNKGGNVTLFAFDAGQQLSEHTAPFDALVYILDGTGNIVIGGIPYELSAGEAIIMPANIPHAVRAPGAFKMMLIMIRDLS